MEALANRSITAQITVFPTLDPITLIQRSDRAESTKDKYKRALAPYLAQGGKLPDVAHLESYAASLSKSRRAHLRSALALWSKATATRIKASVTPETVDQAQAVLMRLEALPEAITVETTKGSKVHTWLSARQVKELTATCGDDITGIRDKVILGLLVGAGLRRQELADLTWDNIKQQPIGDKVRTVLEVKGKGDKWRTVPISDRLVAILKEWAQFTGRQGRIARSLGMAQELGESLSAVSIFRIIQRHGAMIGLSELAAHDLRRTYAQLGFDAGIPITQISTLLGHSSVETTQRYLNLDLDLEVTASDFIPL